MPKIEKQLVYFTELGSKQSPWKSAAIAATWPSKQLRKFGTNLFAISRPLMNPMTYCSMSMRCFLDKLDLLVLPRDSTVHVKRADWWRAIDAGSEERCVHVCSGLLFLFLVCSAKLWISSCDSSLCFDFFYEVSISCRQWNIHQVLVIIRFSLSCVVVKGKADHC